MDTRALVIRETPILVAAKMGILELVQKILQTFPVAIEDLDSSGKNVLMLAAENRQTTVFDHLIKMKLLEFLFNQLDDQGNSILHLAAMNGELEPWCIPGAALQMQWEIKWYKSCSVIAALIAGVAFATSATVPGGLDDKTGHPVLEDHIAFDVFSITSLVALCLSVTALVFFLAIITSRCQERDFKKTLTRKLLMGLSSLCASIVAMLVSFCAGHTFILREKLKYAAVPIYAVACIPVAFFAVAQLPLYFDILWATLVKVPLRSYKSHPTSKSIFILSISTADMELLRSSDSMDIPPGLIDGSSLIVSELLPFRSTSVSRPLVLKDNQ
ncbi:Ankyrin repeat family protein [Abeliophyllum distichum]|uniref:Ankyrin repeat family protein n=1 Tax=Abeliophyllum distichum TaxID=126358 RepID=A0ABD1Q014_9LAMI